MAEPVDVVRTVWEARRLLAEGWTPDIPLRPSEVEGEWTVCWWNHPMAERFPIEDAVLRAAGGDNEVCGRVMEILDQLVVRSMGDPALPALAYPGEKPGQGWGGSLACPWEREPGRTQGHVVELLDQAKRKVRAAWRM